MASERPGASPDDEAGAERRGGASGGERVEERAEIARAQRGDTRAFNRLVERYQSAAYALALRMVGDPDLAADITQDAFLAAFSALPSLRGGSFRAWLFRIVSNGCYDAFRARSRRPATSLDALLAGDPDDETAASADARLPAPLVDAGADPERLTLRAEVIEAIQAALLLLPDEQRLALILCDIQGLAYEEIARVMETSIGTVKSRIARGRARLRELLIQRGAVEGELSERPRRQISKDSESRPL